MSLRKLLALPSLLATLTVGLTSAWADEPPAEPEKAEPVQADPEPPADDAGRASARYANMTEEEAFAELDRRGVPYRKVEEQLPGIMAPVRLTGPLHGVSIHSSLPEEKRALSIFEVLDARLALALDDFTAILERRGIVEIIHYTMYRPNGLPPGMQLEHDHDEPDDAPPPAAKPNKATKPKALKPKRGKKGKAAKAASPKGLGKGAKEPKETRTAAAKDKKHATKQKTGPSQKKAEPKKAEPKKAEPKKAEPKKAEPKKAEPKKAEPKKAEPKKADKKPALKKAPETKSATKVTDPKKGAAKKTTAKKDAAKKGAGKKDLKKGKKAEEAPVKVVSYAPPGTRHPAGLAIDVGQFRKSDGKLLNVAQHFKGHLGARTCGTGSPRPDGHGGELWDIACEAVDLGIFTYVLTPNYNRDHFDHFHMEIRPNVSWYWVR